MRRPRHQSQPTTTPIVSTGPNLATEIHDGVTIVRLTRVGDQVILHADTGIGSIAVSCAAARALADSLTAITQEQTR